MIRKSDWAFSAVKSNSEESSGAIAGIAGSEVLFIDATSWSTDFQGFIIILTIHTLLANSVDSVKTSKTITGICKFVEDLISLADDEWSSAAFQRGIVGLSLSTDSTLIKNLVKSVFTDAGS